MISALCIFLLDFLWVLCYNILNGALAQLGAHHTGSVGVRGSSPLCSTSAEPARASTLTLAEARLFCMKTLLCYRSRHYHQICTVKTAESLRHLSWGHSFLFAHFLHNRQFAFAQYTPVASVTGLNYNE